MTEGPIQDITMSAADVMTASDSHGCVEEQYRPMRGQAYVEVLKAKSSVIHLIDGNPRQEKNHRGRVIALGAPMRLTEHPASPEIPWHCEPGDEIVFVLAVWMDKMRTMRMPQVEGPVVVVAQAEIFGVLEK